jgi:predicted ferric reductase
VNQALWFASRATGLVSLLLLSATIMLGTATTSRFASTRWPRFTVVALHRNLSLLALVFLAVHICGAIIDPYAGIRWADAFVPFVSDYHPFWLGLGAVSIDLILAVVITSLVRGRIPLGVWRAIHWASYAMFPIAVLHGVGIGGGDSQLLWVLCWFAGCVVTVGTAVWFRNTRSHPDTEAREAAELRGWR